VKSDGSELLFAALVERFSVERAIDWLRIKFPSFSTSCATTLACDITPNEKTYFRSAKLLGYVTSMPMTKGNRANRPILVAAVKMRRSTAGWISRLVQFHYAKKILHNAVDRGAQDFEGHVTQGLFFFYREDGSFRLSLVTGDAENGRFKDDAATILSFSFAPMEGNKTASYRLVPPICTFFALKEVFSVESLKKEFCARVLDWYKRALTSEDGRKDNAHISETLIGMVIRLMSAHFVQRCGVLSDTSSGDRLEHSLISLFEQYEFSVEENTADDSEVAIEPEMLGTVFETLLDVPRGEKRDTARNATGSFYTPRKIVDFMVEGAIRHYLDATVKGNANDEEWNKKLDDLFDSEKAAEGTDTLFTQKERRKILSALYGCRILDPACGAGAFPMGVLHCIVRLVMRLDPECKESSCRRQLIENCIFGVEIQRIPMQITIFRLALSLHADLFHFFQALRIDDRGYCTLPGLKPNFVCANTLLIDPDKLFAVKGGFDVAIGNPPYYVIKQGTPFKETYEKLFAHLKCLRMNIYQLFMGKSSTILSDCGCMSFIHPKTLLADLYLSATRKFLLTQFPSFSIVNIGDRHAIKSVLQAVLLTQWSKRPGPCRVAEIDDASELRRIRYLSLSRTDLVLPSGKFLVSKEPLAYKILAKIENVKRKDIKFVSGSIEWNQYKEYLSVRDERHDVRLLFAENVRRYALLESRRRTDISYLSLHTLPTLDSFAVVCQRIVAVEQPWRIKATMIDPSKEDVPIVTENHVNVLKVGDRTECLYILGVLNSALLDYYFRLVNSNTQISSGGLNMLPISECHGSMKSQIADLVENIMLTKKEDINANTEELQTAVDRLVYKLYGLDETEVDFLERCRDCVLKKRVQSGRLEVKDGGLLGCENE